jgi:hypothetical protein
MRRTSIYLDVDLDLRLKRESRRRGVPMADLVREAVREYLPANAGNRPPGAGAFSSGHSDTAERAEDVLAETGFGKSD